MLDEKVVVSSMSQDSPLPILFEDKWLCVINKPTGYSVHRTRGADSDKVILQKLRDQIGMRVYPVHRLDRGTSGCLLFTKSDHLISLIQARWQDELCLKNYRLICRGEIKKSGEFDRPLTSELGKKQHASTFYRPIQTIGGYSFCEVRLITGRRHQIRRHFAHGAHHIVGDVNYGKGWLNRKIREEFKYHEMALHCSELQFFHPIENQFKRVVAPLPQSFNLLREKLFGNSSERIY